MATTDESLQKGIQMARAGRSAEARHILKRIVEQDPRHETAWLWLSGVVETDEQRLTCLENVLAINPHNQAAQRGLTLLRQKAAAIKPLPETTPPPQVIPAPPPPLPTKPVASRPQAKKWYRQGWFLLLTFFFCTPLWALIVLTDRNQGAAVKVLAGIVLVAYVVFVCPSIARELMISIPASTPTAYQVTYQVTGSAQRASVLYWTAGGMEQRAVDLPWTTTFRATKEYQIMNVTAQNEGDSGSIECKILVNGKVTKTAVSTGAYAIVTCGP